MREALRRSVWRVLLLLGVLALTVGAASAAADDEGQTGPGRWIFKYDRSGREPPPELKTPPRYLGTLTWVEERGGEEPTWRLRLDDLREGPKSVYLTEDTKVDGAPAKEKVKTLRPKSHVAIYGEEKDGRFYAKSVFLVPDEDWQAILEAKRAEEERAREEAAPAPGPPPPDEGSPAEEEPLADLAPPAEVGLSEEELGVPREGVEPEASPPDEKEPAEKEHRGDFRATIKTVRSLGAEMSVATEGRIVLVTTDTRTTILEGEKKLTRSDLRDGWTVDVEVARWRGKSNCAAKRIWVVER